MGSTYQTGRTSVTGNVTAVASKTSATIVSATQAGSGSTTLGTVGAGKVWRVIGVALSGNSAGVNNGTATAVLKLNNAEVLGVTIMGTSTIYNTNSNAMNFDYGACPVLTAGQTIVVTCSQATYAHASAIYVEESA